MKGGDEMFEFTDNESALINLRAVTRIEIERDISGAFNVFAYMPNILADQFSRRCLLKSFQTEEEAKAYLLDIQALTFQ